MAEATYSAERIDELLKCAVCLDKYQHPKLLPCQHTFCQSPCLEGLVDRGIRMLRCPECRTEHFVPYNGVAGFPNNLTIANFLDLSAQAATSTTSGTSSAARDQPKTCAVCETAVEDEGGLSRCFHCDKNVCSSCKRSHVGQMKLDIGRLVNQIRRGLPKISNAIGSVEQKGEQLKQHVDTLKGEITSAVEKHLKDMRERQKMLHSELDTFLQSEQRSLRLHQENLEVELASISSYCDSTESLNNAESNVPEADLVNVRKQCSEYMGQLRNIENDSVPQSRVARFQCDSQQLHAVVMTFGELFVSNPNTTATNLVQSNQSNLAQPLQLPGGQGINRVRTPYAAYISRSPSPPPFGHMTFTGPIFEPRGTGSGRAQPSWASQRILQRQQMNRSFDDQPVGGFLGGGSPYNQNTPQRGRGREIGRGRGRSNARPMDQTQQSHVQRTGPAQHNRTSNQEVAQTPAGNNSNSSTAQMAPSDQQTNVPSAGQSTAPSVGQTTAPPTDNNQEQNLPNLDRATTFVRPEGQGNDNAPVVANDNFARFDVRLSLEESLGDILGPDEEDPRISFLYSEGSSTVVTRPSNNYHMKGPMLKKIGLRGSENARFTWPRGVAVSPVNDSILVADSSNHRVQMFDMHCRFLKKFGSYGQAPGEFDCLAGLAVDSSGQIIIADRYNHRIQVFNRYGEVITEFGEEGTGDGQLSYPWGVACDNAGYIYVCDKDNHRIQIFQTNGTFIRKFGRLGSNEGQFENPHYIAIGNRSEIYVSDSSNHRVQVFTNQGEHLRTFGSEGNAQGEFKYPRGIAVDRQGFVVVGDSGNNRIQVFRGDGAFFCSWGSWGNGNGQVKGIEGVALTSNGNVIVSDRENHRIQIF